MDTPFETNLSTELERISNKTRMNNIPCPSWTIPST